MAVITPTGMTEVDLVIQAWPIIAGKSDSSKAFKVIPVEEMGRHSVGELQEYLGLTAAQGNSPAKQNHGLVQRLAQIEGGGDRELCRGVWQAAHGKLRS